MVTSNTRSFQDKFEHALSGDFVSIRKEAGWSHGYQGSTPIATRRSGFKLFGNAWTCVLGHQPRCAICGAALPGGGRVFVHAGRYAGVRRQYRVGRGAAAVRLDKRPSRMPMVHGARCVACRCRHGGYRLGRLLSSCRCKRPGVRVRRGHVPCGRRPHLQLGGRCAQGKRHEHLRRRRQRWLLHRPDHGGCFAFGIRHARSCRVPCAYGVVRSGALLA